MKRLILLLTLCWPALAGDGPSSALFLSGICYSRTVYWNNINVIAPWPEWELASMTTEVQNIQRLVVQVKAHYPGRLPDMRMTSQEYRRTTNAAGDLTDEFVSYYKDTIYRSGTYDDGGWIATTNRQHRNGLPIDRKKALRVINGDLEQGNGYTKSQVHREGQFLLINNSDRVATWYVNLYPVLGDWPGSKFLTITKRSSPGIQLWKPRMPKARWWEFWTRTGPTYSDEDDGTLKRLETR